MATSEQLKVLKQHFPNCFDKNGAFIPDKLQAIVEENGVKVATEGYSLNWLGKSYARLLTNEAPRTLLKADAVHNAQPDNLSSQNLLIEGDNLEVLKHLKGAYSRQVKMIYIDPPYNTGSDGFVYDDDRKFTAEQLSHLAGISEEEASRVLDFTNSKSNSHSAWLTFMYPRLYLARELLRDDGVIFISIDDNEQAQLRMLCDDVFGEENFVAKLNILCNPKGRSQDKYFATNHEYAFAYSNTVLPKGFFSIEKDQDQIEAEYSEEDEAGKFRLLELRNTHREFGKHNRKDMHFPIYVNDNGEVSMNSEEGQKILPIWEDGYEGCWTWGKPKAVNEIELLTSKKISGRWKIYRKSYANGAERMLKTILSEKTFFTERGQKEFSNLFQTKARIFQSPKSSFFITELLRSSTAGPDLVMDFFAGSGTTADAVMRLNAEDGGNRQFICVQLPEVTDVKSEAHKAGYSTIFDITHARITKAAVKIKAEYPDYQGDLGFKVFETIPLFEGYADEPEELSANLEMFNGDTLTEQDRFNLLLTWAVQDGISLTSELTPVELAGYIAYQGGEAGRLLYFIHPKLSLDVVVELLRRLDDDAKFAPKHLVVWGYGLESKEQREMSEAIAHHNKSNRKGIELDLEVRF